MSNKTKTAWDIINSNLNRKKLNKISPNLTCDDFNKFFKSIREELVEQLPKYLDKVISYIKKIHIKLGLFSWYL